MRLAFFILKTSKWSPPWQFQNVDYLLITLSIRKNKKKLQKRRVMGIFRIRIGQKH